ncbi:Uncharacterized protein Fot_19684 [Forsythia ovata]|uniref:Uncharacterized protein n=1 Tax=Forsythia ovata TaxID=205694 RepID=A0ABD1VNS0_9LAMI
MFSLYLLTLNWFSHRRNKSGRTPPVGRRRLSVRALQFPTARKHFLKGEQKMVCANFLTIFGIACNYGGSRFVKELHIYIQWKFGVSFWTHTGTDRRPLLFVAGECIFCRRPKWEKKSDPTFIFSGQCENKTQSPDSFQHHFNDIQCNFHDSTNLAKSTMEEPPSLIAA